MEDRSYIFYWLRIHRVAGGKASFLSAYERYPEPDRLCDFLENGRVRSKSTVSYLNGATDEDVEKTVERCRELGCVIIPFDSEDYPSALRNIKDPPAVLFAMGNVSLLRGEKKLAVVGTRNASDTGVCSAFGLSCGLSSAGVTVVSGGAAGIDIFAGYGACTGRGGTVVVLGEGFRGGADCYPLIGAGNTVYITELFPGTYARPFNFPRRNRIIAGMSCGVAVIEAGKKSGALITAGICAEQKKHIFAPDTSILQSDGCSELLTSGAHPFTCARECVNILFGESDGEENGFTDIAVNSDVFCDIMPDKSVGKRKRTPQRNAAHKKISDAPYGYVAEQGEEQKQNDRQLPEYMTDDARKVYSVLKNEPELSDMVLAECNMSASVFLSAVTELELEGLICVYPGNRISRR